MLIAGKLNAFYNANRRVKVINVQREPLDFINLFSITFKLGRNKLVAFQMHFINTLLKCKLFVQKPFEIS